MGILTPGPRGEPRLVTPRGDLADYEQDLIQIFEDNAPSVAHITTLVEGRDYFWGRQTYQEGAGSGFVWDASGTVVTNYHVVKNVVEGGGRRLRVALKDEIVTAIVVGASPEHDIAILRLQNVSANLRPIPLGTSADLKVGQAVVAIGNPFGLDHTLTTGVISALNRTIQTNANQELRDTIQVDAAINPGNSGGPLLDSAGRLIGMTAALYSPSGTNAGIGFAVPVDTINEIVPDLIAGRSSRYILGIRTRSDLVPQLPVETGYPSGVIVTEITPGYGAEAAGMQAYEVVDQGRRFGVRRYGDVIVEVDGQPVRRFADLAPILRNRRSGETVTVKVLRGRDMRPVSLEVELKRSVL
jgi:S1-C subfamily serine protease